MRGGRVARLQNVDDAYAFDIDQPVTVTLTYASALTTRFTVVWDRNGGNSLGRTDVERKREAACGTSR